MLAINCFRSSDILMLFLLKSGWSIISDIQYSMICQLKRPLHLHWKRGTVQTVINRKCCQSKTCLLPSHKVFVPLLRGPCCPTSPNSEFLGYPIHRGWACTFESSFLQNPRSAIFSVSLCIKMLANLRSLCNTYFSCRAYMPARICFM